MNLLYLIAAIVLFFVLYNYITFEPFRGGRRGGGGRRRGGWRGGGWRGRGFNPNRYVRRFRRGRRRPWFPYWNNVTVWPSSWYYSPVPCNCKRGCTPDGCAYPGTGPYDCVWASDCNCC